MFAKHIEKRFKNMANKQTRTWWSITAFDEDEIKKLEAGEYPQHVKRVLGGREQCPETGRIHFQGAVATRSCRFTQMKKWLPKAHIEPAKCQEALARYAMKEETAVDVKQERPNTRKYMSMAQALYQVAVHSYDYLWEDPDNNYREAYWYGVRQHIRVEGQEDDISLYSQPQMQRAWNNTWQVWLHKVRQNKRATPIVLQGEPEVEPEGVRRSGGGSEISSHDDAPQHGGSYTYYSDTPPSTSDEEASDAPSVAVGLADDDDVAAGRI